ncbi:MAG TPA: glycoside hydrolase family 3 N-terminal domain-containing protein [Chthoniobacterales bacterium]|nr:glycoside hydrolase family 3 N-terminal domain-containing protein [Chthoniobacterales bacterium]
MIKNLAPLFVLSATLFTAAADDLANAAYKNPKLPIEERIADLLKRMTPEEKARQLDMYAGNGYVVKAVRETGIENHAKGGGKDEDKEGLFDKFANPTHVTPDAKIVPANLKEILGDVGVGSFHDIYPNAEQSNALQKWVIENSRLGIPAMFIEEGLHGSLDFNETVFPAPINLGTTWNIDLAHQTGAAIAAEMRATGVDMALGPVLDLSREPRWGRVEETMGEDVWLVSQMGVNYVEGMQGESLATDRNIVATPKHFAGHGSPDAGLNTSSLHAGEREMRSAILKAFQPSIEQGKAMSVMAAYHERDGVPCSADPWLLTEILRKEWGFDGFVVSDLGAIRNLFVRYHVAATPEDAICMSINAGMNMQFYDFDHAVWDAAIVNGLKNGKLTAATLDRAVADVLRVKFRLGLFDHPYVDPKRDALVRRVPAHNELSLESARQSMCLLKNDKGVLPLSKSLKHIAVIGENGNIAQLGDYADGAKERDCTTMLEALKTLLPNAEITFDSGADINAAVEKAKAAEVVILGLGERQGISGEGHDRQTLDLPENQQALLEAVVGTGVPSVLVLQNGRPLAITWAAEHVPAILEAWYPGEFGGTAIAETLFGDNNPAGRLPITFPRSTGQLPVYYSYNQGGRGGNYVDGSKEPLYVFGHGLSFTTFKYDGLQVTTPAAGAKGDITVNVKITNTGKRDGDEVAQLYVHQKVASVLPPNRALKGFQRVHLKAGESKSVTFQIKQSDLALWNASHEWAVEPGEYEVMVGGSSVGTTNSSFHLP